MLTSCEGVPVIRFCKGIFLFRNKLANFAQYYCTYCNNTRTFTVDEDQRPQHFVIYFLRKTIPNPSTQRQVSVLNKTIFLVPYCCVLARVADFRIWRKKVDQVAQAPPVLSDNIEFRF